MPGTGLSNEEHAAKKVQSFEESHQNPHSRFQHSAAAPNDKDSKADYPPPDEHERVVLPSASPTAPQTPYRSPQELAAIARVRKCATAGIICGIVSLFIGGMVLSAIAIVFSFASYRIAAPFMNSNNSSLAPAWKEQQIRIRTALIMSICAFVLSVLSFIFLYPVMIEFLQANGFDSLPLGSDVSDGGSAGNTAIGGSSGDSIWG